MVHEKDVEKRKEAKEERKEAQKKKGKLKQRKIERENMPPPDAKKHKIKKNKRGDNKA